MVLAKTIIILWCVHNRAGMMKCKYLTTPLVNVGQNILKCVWVKMKNEIWCQAITNVEYSCNKQHWLYMCICNLSVCHWCRYRTHPCRVSEALLSHITPMLSPARYRRSSLAERFSAELPGLSLPQVLSTLELPRQMAELKATYADVRYRLIITCVSYSWLSHSYQCFVIG